MVTSDGVHALEQFILAKYYLHTQVYARRVRLITDQMLVRAICLGIEVDELEELHSLYTYDGSDKFLKRFLEWDDSRFMQTFCDAKLEGKYCQMLLRRLHERRLLKLVYSESLKELPECGDLLSRISEPNNKRYGRT